MSEVRERKPVVGRFRTAYRGVELKRFGRFYFQGDHSDFSSKNKVLIAGK